MQAIREPQRIGTGRALQGDALREQFDTALRLADARVDFAEHAEHAEHAEQACTHERLIGQRGAEQVATVIEQIARADVATARIFRVGIVEQAQQEFGGLLRAACFGECALFGKHSAIALHHEPYRCTDHTDQRKHSRCHRSAMPADEFADAITEAIRSGFERQAGEIIVDLASERGGGVVTTFGFGRQRAMHDMIEIAIDARRVVAYPYRLGLQRDTRRSRLAPAAGLAAGFIRLAAQQCVQDQTKTKHVARGGYWLAGNLLGAGVVDGKCAQLGGVLAAGVGCGKFGDAEVEQQRRVITAHDYVGGFQIAMHDEVLMRVMHRATELLEKAQARRQRRHFFCPPNTERQAFDIFHHEERLAFGGGAAIEQARDIRMYQTGQNLAFAAQALECVGGWKTTDQLDRDLALIFAIRAFGQIHATHAAVADFADDAIVADAPAEPRCGCVEMRCGGGGDTRSERIAGFVVAREQGVEFVAQGEIVAACNGRKTSALFRRQRDRGFEQFAKADEVAHTRTATA